MAVKLHELIGGLNPDPSFFKRASHNEPNSSVDFDTGKMLEAAVDPLKPYLRNCGKFQLAPLTVEHHLQLTDDLSIDEQGLVIPKHPEAARIGYDLGLHYVTVTDHARHGLLRRTPLPQHFRVVLLHDSYLSDGSFQVVKPPSDIMSEDPRRYLNYLQIRQGWVGVDPRKNASWDLSVGYVERARELLHIRD